MGWVLWVLGPAWQCQSQVLGLWFAWAELWCLQHALGLALLQGALGLCWEVQLCWDREEGRVPAGHPQELPLLYCIALWGWSSSQFLSQV